jgi:hypothetical protein
MMGFAGSTSKDELSTVSSYLKHPYQADRTAICVYTVFVMGLSLETQFGREYTASATSSSQESSAANEVHQGWLV